MRNLTLQARIKCLIDHFYRQIIGVSLNWTQGNIKILDNKEGTKIGVDELKRWVMKECQKKVVIVKMEGKRKKEKLQNVRHDKAEENMKRKEIRI